MSDDRGKAENSTGSSDTDDAAASSRPTGKRPGRRSSAAADSSAATTVAATGASPAPAKKVEKPRKENLFKRFRRFLREVLAELRKVIWPNRKQMVTYTTVVLVFVAFMVAFIFGLDLAFVKGVTWLFG